ncbi:hypothetical protein HN51_044571, partial [Arachis hypogaea]
CSQMSQISNLCVTWCLGEVAKSETGFVLHFYSRACWIFNSNLRFRFSQAQYVETEQLRITRKKRGYGRDK